MVRHNSGPRRLAGRAAALLLTVSASACGMRSGDLKGHASDTRTRNYTLQDGGELQVVGGIGKINVQGGTGATIAVKAERRVRAATDDGAKAMVPRVRI